MRLQLTVRDLHKVYEAGLGRCVARVDVLRGVSFTLANGERLALLGGPASGKTTLLQCLAGLRQPDSGEVRWSRSLQREGARTICSRPEQLRTPRADPLLIDLSEAEHSIIEWAEHLHDVALRSWILVARRLGPITHLCNTVAILEDGVVRLRPDMPTSRRVAEGGGTVGRSDGRVILRAASGSSVRYAEPAPRPRH